MHASFRIRAAHAADATLLAQWNAIMAWETEQLTLEPATVLAGVVAGIADPSLARYFVAMRDVPVAGREVLAEPVGTLMLTREWSDWRCGEWWWIQSVYVMPEHRRAGVFTALYRHVEQLARDSAGVIGLRLYVEHDNRHAQQTYAALGMADASYRVFESTLKKVDRT